MAQRGRKGKAAVVEIPRDEFGFELVACACRPFPWKRLLSAGSCGECGAYTCDDCSATVDHPATPCVTCAPRVLARS